MLANRRSRLPNAFGNRTGGSKRNRRHQRLTQKQLAAERELQKISSERAKALDAEKEKQQAIADQIAGWQKRPLRIPASLKRRETPQSGRVERRKQATGSLERDCRA